MKTTLIRSRIRLAILTLAGIFPLMLHAQYSMPVKQVIEIQPENYLGTHLIVQDLSLYIEEWDTMAQPRFWQQVMNLDPELSYINIASTRKILDVIITDDYDALESEEKKAYKDSICVEYSLQDDTEIYITSGKQEYYQIEEMIPTIGKAIGVFQEEGIDPWYAQAILLIESPGQLRRSNRGAYGSFQLMKSVARAQGLTITSTVDERKDLYKSAGAAARLLRNVCIPHAKAILDGRNIYYSESDLWFRLFVLHIYHAGARNVRSVITEIDPWSGGPELIRTLWRTESRSFRNASQNYSQIVLASMLELDRLVHQKGEFCMPRPVAIQTQTVSLYDEITDHITRFFASLRQRSAEQWDNNPLFQPSGGMK